MNLKSLDSIADVIADIKSGKMVIVVDDESRENEGDLIVAAEKVSPETINFMATHGRGLICTAMTSENLDRLRLSKMTSRHARDSFDTAFMESVDARKGVTTGISAGDRAVTVKVLADPGSGPDDIVSPGHVFPLEAKSGGVLRRAGHTEAAVDLARLAGLAPTGVICEILREDGQMARLPDLKKFAAQHSLKISSVADLIAWRRQREKLIEQRCSVNLPTEHGVFKLILYGSLIDSEVHVALVMGEPDKVEAPLVRVHSECLTGDVFKSVRCDCGSQLDTAMKMVAAEGVGVVLYMRQEGRGIGLENKVHAYALQDKGMDTVEANEHLGFADDLRDYGFGAQMLLDLGLKKIRLMTNNPRKIVGLQGYGLEIVERIAVLFEATVHNKRYLDTKKSKMGHLL